MDQKAEKFTKGIAWFIAFSILIAAGIISKRVFNHPEHMMMYHLPAAICLAIWGQIITKKFREKNNLLILHRKKF